MPDQHTTDAGDLGVAYLVSQYPALSHAFIEREVHALRGHGARVDTFTLNPCPPEQLVSATMREDARQTYVVKDKRRAALANLALLRSQPDVWLRGVRRALRTGELAPRPRLWQLFYLAEAVTLHREMRRRGLRHVHVHFANAAADVARLTVALARDLGEDWSWSFSMHGPTEFESVERFDLPAKVRSADGVACISDFCRSQLMRMVDPAVWPRLDVVRMTVDPQDYPPPAQPRARTASDPLRVLYVGRLVPEKGGPVLLDAVTRLREEGVPLRVRMVGAGPLHESLARTISERGLGDVVELVGPLGQEQLPDEYRQADVFCLPSFQEGLPVVLMEAMSTELPVVTTRIAGITELVVDGENGHVIPAGRADLLAQALSEVACRPELSAAQGAAGRAAVLREFTPSTAAPGMIAFLRRVTEGRARS
ncbi:glycosyltransferase [Arsenicicoccus sp. oral taxon 190]|uniref:glycosyltransferase n=1 Tax=Arsenicicoccus sp. oral taxon 190 TaxID=1658671 RepID=UPI00067A279F|nr:glycosyltransferase [Arsenicicoccus sp. oral taxon 190]AKT52366.1 glycosyl transferase [Arsenicicoccus sp. oral taxon 190]